MRGRGEADVSYHRAMGTRWRGAGVAAVALLALAAACRQLVGIGAEPPTDLADAGAPASDAGADVEAAPSSGLSFPPGPCNTCLQGECLPAAEACAQNPACAAFASCLGGCGDDIACRGQCINDHPVGTGQQVPTLLTCLESHCQSDCQLACGGIPTTVQVDAATSCYDCLSANACDAASACLTDLECESVLFCVFATHTIDTRQACDDGRDAGAALWATLLQDYSGSCSTQCDVGQNWYCVGRVTWPVTAAPQVATTVVVDEEPIGSAVPGVPVTACLVAEPTCDPPIASGITDSTGSVPLALQEAGVGSPGVDAVFELGAVDAGAGTALFPELVFVGYPLTEPTSQYQTPVVTRDELASLLPGGITLDPSRGHVLLSARDCIFGNSAGVTFDITANGLDGGETTLLYEQGLTFVAGLTATDATGNALLVNVPPGNVVVRARPQALGGAVSSTEAFFVRAGWLSGVVMVPTP